MNGQPEVGDDDGRLVDDQAKRRPTQEVVAVDVVVIRPQEVEAEKGHQGVPETLKKPKNNSVKRQLFRTYDVVSPDDELPDIKQPVLGNLGVELRLLEQPLCADVLLEEAEDEDGQEGVGDVEQGQVDGVVQRLRRVVVEQRVEALRREAGHVLVERVLNKDGHAVVVPKAKRLIEQFSLN